MKLRHLIPALLFGALPLATVSTSQAQVEFSVNFAPPPLPVYVQPACPEEGYIWTPGYWNYAEEDYYWVPGIWVAPPRPRLLWTPGYWGYENNYYGFHRGYWGDRVGFYGGVNYGWGYGGHGFYGGRWEGDRYRYNTAVVNVNRTVIKNVYVDKTVIKNINRNGGGASFNGPNGIQAKARTDELAAEKAEHVPPTAEQMSHRENAAKNKEAFAKVNQGKPALTAEARPGAGANPAQPANAQPNLTPKEEKAQRQEAKRQERANAGGPQPAANNPGGMTPQEQKAQRQEAKRQERAAQGQPAANPGGMTPQEQKAQRQEAKRQERAAQGQPGNGMSPQEQKAQRQEAKRQQRAAQGQPGNGMSPQEQKAQRQEAKRQQRANAGPGEQRPEARRPAAPAGNPGRPGPAQGARGPRPHPQGQPGRPGPQAQRQGPPRGEGKKEGDKKHE